MSGTDPPEGRADGQGQGRGGDGNTAAGGAGVMSGQRQRYLLLFRGAPKESQSEVTAYRCIGLFEQWSPLRLTNYTIDASGAGTVQILGSSSLVNSTLEMDGPGLNLLNEGLMTLQNSSLDINGSLAGTGMILASGGSTVDVVFSAPIKDAYQQPLTKQQSSDLASAQPQLISLKSSTLNIEGNNYTGPVIMDAKSTINIDSALNVGAKNFGVYATGPQLGTVNFNADAAPHITGIMQIDANLNINCKQHVDIDGGRLIIAGASAGDTIDIKSGALEFAQTPGFLQAQKPHQKASTRR